MSSELWLKLDDHYEEKFPGRTRWTDEYLYEEWSMKYIGGPGPYEYKAEDPKKLSWFILLHGSC